MVGTVVCFGRSLRVTLNLHHTETGELRGSKGGVKGKTVEALESPLRHAAGELFSKIISTTQRVASLRPQESFAERMARVKRQGQEEGRADDASGYQSEIEELCRLAEQKVRLEARIKAEHEKRTSEAWIATRDVIDRGDEVAGEALRLFLAEFTSHPLGNPYADEARRRYQEARFSYEQRMNARHRAEVERAWDELQPIIKVKDKRAKRAIKIFIKRYAKHPRGNPLAEMAQEALDALTRGNDYSQSPTNPQVLIKTSHGDITLELYPQKTPITVKTFISYVKSGHYNGMILHRVINNFMIQGGGYTGGLFKKPTRAPIVLENRGGLSNLRGSIAMARTSNPNSATSQFFINVVNNRSLDTYGGGYTVFGQVIEGMETVDRIRIVPTVSKSGHRNVPTSPVVIKSMRLLP